MTPFLAFPLHALLFPVQSVLPTHMPGALALLAAALPIAALPIVAVALLVPPMGLVPTHALGPHPTTARLVDVVLTPNTTSLPGGQVLQNLMNGLGGWALALALVGLVIGAAAWALGSHGQNYQQSYVGRRAVLISGLAALLIGAGPAIVNFFFHAGQGVH